MFVTSGGFVKLAPMVKLGMQKLAWGVFLWFGIAAYGIKTITFAERDVDGTKVFFEVVDGLHYRATKITHGEETLTVLVPGFQPLMATDGKKFFEIDSNFRKLPSSFTIEEGGKLMMEENAVPGKKQEILGRNVLAQVNQYLLSKPVSQRPGKLIDVEQFLLKQVRDAETPVHSLGIFSGASLVQGADQYLILGNQRYSGLLIRDGAFYYYDASTESVSNILMDAQNRIKLKKVGKENEAPLLAPLEAETALFRRAMDTWPESSPEVRAFYLPFVKSKLLKGGKAIKIDWGHGVTPSSFGRDTYLDEKGRTLDKKDLQLRALNYALNFIGSNPKAKPVPFEKSGPNQILANVSDFMGAEKVARLSAANPYACSLSDHQALRLDWLLSHLQKDRTYREMADIPDTLANLERTLGVTASPQPHSEDNQNVGIPVSGVALSIRALNRQPQKNVEGRPFYQSFDFAVDKAGVLLNANADFARHPSGFQHNVGEFIYLRKNAYQAFAIYNAVPPGSPGEGESLPAATDSLVLDKESSFGPFVHNPRSCVQCHAGGMRSPLDQTPADPKEWMLSEEKFQADAEVKKRFGTYEKYKAAVEKYFGDAAKFLEDATKDRKSFRQALEDSSAFVTEKNGEEPISLLSKYFAAYDSNVSLDQAARELDTSPPTLRRFLERNGPFRIDRLGEGGKKEVYNIRMNALDGHFTRAEFELIFCEIKAGLKEEPLRTEAAGATDTVHK